MADSVALGWKRGALGVLAAVCVQTVVARAEGTEPMTAIATEQLRTQVPTPVLEHVVEKAAAQTSAQRAERLQQRWAPVYVQHVHEGDHGADRPTRIDFDGNWDATDNWNHQAELGTNLPPAAYGAAILTRTHAYLTYTLYYPRDWSWLCISLVCHDNDLETVQLIVKRDAADGQLVGVRTKAHHSMADVPAAKIARSADGRPMLKVESQGHGISVCKRGDAGCAARPGRLVYVPGATPSRPPGRALGQQVTYELLSLHDTLWAHRGLDARLWTSGETGPLFYAGRRQGRRGHVMGAAMASSQYEGGVRPPWALKGPTGRRGDWFLDPASDRQHTASYDYNPYLDDLSRECKAARCRPAPPEPSRAKYFAMLGLKRAAPYVVFALGFVAVTGLLRSRATGPLF